MTETGGYIEPIVTHETQGDESVESLPRSITIPLQIGYEKRFFEHFDRSHFKAEEFIREVAALSMNYFIQVQNDRDFPTITWKIDRKIERYIDFNINSDELCDKVDHESKIKRNEMKKMRRGMDKPLIIFSEDFIYQGETPHLGCAFRSSICRCHSLFDNYSLFIKVHRPSNIPALVF